MKKYLILGAIAILPLTIFASTYKTRSNDTLQNIATKTGLTLQQVAEQNPNLKIVSNQNINYPTPAPTPTPTPTPTPVPSGSEIAFKAYVTAYTYWDNTPPGSADIALPVLHSKAGGTGTYADPITVAVGHSITGSVDTPDYAKGTRFYIHGRYYIVEDVCGDGRTPQNGPCHTGFKSPAKAWLDVWIDGANTTASKSTACANALTEVWDVIQNPLATYPVTSGPIITSAGTCNW